MMVKMTLLTTIMIEIEQGLLVMQPRDSKTKNIKAVVVRQKKRRRLRKNHLKRFYKLRKEKQPIITLKVGKHSRKDRIYSLVQNMLNP